MAQPRDDGVELEPGDSLTIAGNEIEITSEGYLSGAGYARRQRGRGGPP
jgi:hypothetical protein